jgi:hypothetical protein
MEQLPPTPGASERVPLEVRVAALEAQLRELMSSKTNSPKFWTRALAILGHVLVFVGIWFGVPIAVWFIVELVVVITGGSTS